MKTLSNLAKTLAFDDVENLEAQLGNASFENLREARRQYSAANPDLNENCKWLTAEVAKRLKQLQDKKAPTPIGAFDRDEIARVLTTDTDTWYDAFFYDPKNATRRAHAAGRQKALPIDRIQATVFLSGANERVTRRKFLEVFYKYLDCARNRAHALKLHEACEAYSKAWVHVKSAYQDSDQHPLDAEKALLVIDAEEKATKMLIAGMKGAAK